MRIERMLHRISPQSTENTTDIQSEWLKKILIAPIPEHYRYEFISQMVRHNFQLNFQAVTIAIIVIVMIIFIIDIFNLPALSSEELQRGAIIHTVLLVALLVAYLTGRHLKRKNIDLSMIEIDRWGTFFRTFISIVFYWFLYDVGKGANNLHVIGPFAAFIGIITAGQYASERNTMTFVVLNAIIFSVIVLFTSGDMRSTTNCLFTGNAVLVIAALSSNTLFRKFCQEFVMTKRVEEERQKAEELNAQLEEANEEISQQVDILNEQAREIELSNITLQEQNLVIEQDRKQIHESKALLDIAHAQSEGLLLNILPAPIAVRLKSGERAIADRFDSVTVLFADIVGFTKLSAQTTPEELVRGLNAIFGRFDTLAKHYGLEKIKTIGDAYMVAGGLPERSDKHDHAERVARFALDILAAMGEETLRTSKGETVQLRIGIHTGEAVAGVIGTSKFAYDLWGDTVNTASRMESHGEPGRIHVTLEVHDALNGAFAFEQRGEIEVKGKGVMRTWFLVGK
jgi:class 3 adenylate cyclase